jgi:transglutaminase-like putative cysteine protease
MGWRIRVVHSTGYRYDAPVHQSYNEVRLTPRTDSRQNVIVSRVETTPATRHYRYNDYWGTAVTAFDLHAPHKELAVVATSVVETGDPQPPADGAGWADLDGDAVRDRHTEMLEFTGYVGRERELAKVARVLHREPTPVEAVHAACRWVHEHLTYQRAPPVCTPRRWRPGRPGAGCARTSCTSRCSCCARRACRPATSRATCYPMRRRGSARP